MDNASLQPFLDWLALNHQWLAGTIFLVSLLESLAIVGLVMPGVFILFGAAALAGSGALPLWAALSLAFAGAVIGDGLSFLLGRAGKDHIRGWWPFTRHPYWLINAEQFFHKHGGKSVVMGRFIGPIRPVMPLVAGMLGMKPWKFFSINGLSAIGWAPLYIMPGFLVGASVQWHTQLPPEFGHLVLGLAAAALVVSYIGCWLNRHWQQQKLWQQIQLALPVTALLLLTVAVWSGAFAGVNDQVNLWMEQLRTPLLQHLMLILTLFGNASSQILMVLPLAACLFYMRQYRATIVILGALVGHAALVQAIKFTVALPRPPEATVTGFSFPSGHTSTVATMMMVMAIIFGRSRAWSQQALLWAGALLLAMMMGLSRLILGAHWISDVSAGLLVGMVVSAVASRILPREGIPRLPLCIALLIGVALTALLIQHRFAAAILLYQIH